MILPPIIGRARRFSLSVRARLLWGGGKWGLSAQKSALKLAEKQAVAAIGQILLNHAWQQAFAKHHLNVAQILLTYGDTETRRRHLNARNTILQLLKFKSIPIINENDTVATEEIRYGDNDRLAARLAVMVEADLLLLLSDIDGLYDAHPEQESQCQAFASDRRDYARNDREGQS